LKHLFPIGEVNGSHGVTRPGGSALNAGQVAGFRAAEYIANKYSGWTLIGEEVDTEVKKCTQQVIEWSELCEQATITWSEEIQQIQDRMSRSGAHIRSLENLIDETPAAWDQFSRLAKSGCKIKSLDQLKFAFRARQLAFAQAVYLDAIKFSLENGVGSRGSSIVLDVNGNQVHELLDSSWKIASEDVTFRSKVLETYFTKEEGIRNRWVSCRPSPESDSWFETTWARFRNGEIYS
jgi:hypothetical protein